MKPKPEPVPLCSECVSWPCICPAKDVYLIGQPGGDSGDS